MYGMMQAETLALAARNSERERWRDGLLGEPVHGFYMLLFCQDYNYDRRREFYGHIWTYHMQL